METPHPEENRADQNKKKKHELFNEKEFKTELKELTFVIQDHH